MDEKVINENLIKNGLAEQMNQRILRFSDLIEVLKRLATSGMVGLQFQDLQHVPHMGQYMFAVDGVGAVILYRSHFVARMDPPNPLGTYHSYQVDPIMQMQVVNVATQVSDKLVTRPHVMFTRWDFAEEPWSCMAEYNWSIDCMERPGPSDGLNAMKTLYLFMTMVCEDSGLSVHEIGNILKAMTLVSAHKEG